MLVLQARGEIDFPLFLFANTGDDSENPATLRYVREVAVPYALDHGIEIGVLDRRRGGKPDGEVVTLLQQISRPESRSIELPVYLKGAGPGRHRCSDDFKIAVTNRELRRRGANPEEPALVAIGISTDEIERAHPGLDPKSPMRIRTYPLLDLGLDRHACRKIIADAGLPVPPKSACWFCPMHDHETWRKQRRESPDLFAKACGIEAMFIERRAMLSKDAVYLSKACRPLDQAIDDQLAFEGMETCDSGACFT